LGRPVPVASYPPNGFGLYDMHGNVCELVADSWHDTYADAPTDGSAWSAASSGLRVVRNGGWDAMPRLLRCAYRDWIDPTARYDNVGFRVACEVGGIEYDRRDAEGAETAAEKKRECFICDMGVSPMLAPSARARRPLPRLNNPFSSSLRLSLRPLRLCGRIRFFQT
jgi:hypothetical protein